MTPQTFLLTDPRLMPGEFAARSYPDTKRRTATTLFNRALKRDTGELGATLAHAQVQQLATDLTAGLRRPEGRPGAHADEGLLALARDARLKQKALAVAVYAGLAPASAERYWSEVGAGERELTPSERRVLRTELQALAAKCQQIAK
jgi:hypothetical protein